jgi:hypothetical protein
LSCSSQETIPTPADCTSRQYRLNGLRDSGLWQMVNNALLTPGHRDAGRDVRLAPPAAEKAPSKSVLGYSHLRFKVLWTIFGDFTGTPKPAMRPTFSRFRVHSSCCEQPLQADQVRRSTRHPSRRACSRADCALPRVADDRFETPFEHRIDRAPVDARALQADMRHAFSCQPVAQASRSSVNVPKIRTSDLRRLRPSWKGGGDHRCLMHIKPGYNA